MRFLFLFSYFTLLANAEFLSIKAGWQLVGVPTTLNISETFSDENIKIIWGFNAKEQQWSAYSSDNNISKAIVNKYPSLEVLEPFQAFWVYSKSDWQLEYEYDENINENTYNYLTLEKG